MVFNLKPIINTQKKKMIHNLKTKIIILISQWEVRITRWISHQLILLMKMHMWVMNKKQLSHKMRKWMIPKSLMNLLREKLKDSRKMNKKNSKNYIKTLLIPNLLTIIEDNDDIILWIIIIFIYLIRLMSVYSGFPTR